MTLGPDATFEEVAARLAEVYDTHQSLKREVEDLKARLRELVGTTDGLRRDKSSLYLDLPFEGKSVGVSDPDIKSVVNPTKLRSALRERLGDDQGDELFLELVNVKSVELNVDKWLQALEDELVTEQLLLDCLDESIVTPTVRVTKLKRLA